MKLQPVTSKSEESYPSRRQSRSKKFKRWIRKLGTAVGVSIALCAVGCPGWRISGAMEPPEYYEPDYFSCSDSADQELMAGAGSYEGSFCPGGSASGSFYTWTQGTYSFSFSSGIDVFADIQVIDESGNVIGTHESPGDPLELELDAGTYDISIQETGTNQVSFFYLYIDEINL